MGAKPTMRSFFATLAAIENVMGESRRALLTQLGVGWAPRILSYRGFATGSKARVLARLVEDRGTLAPALDRGLYRGALASVHRFRTAELPGVPVELRWGPHVHRCSSDAEGFVDEVVPVPEGTPDGVHQLELHTNVGRRGASIHVPVSVQRGASFGIISDIDDTLIDAHVTNRASRAVAMTLSEAWPRQPFPDAARMCHALVGDPEDGPRPIFYVSSSPWNLYDHLEHFLQVHGFPWGPLLLRDWGPSREGFAPDGRHGHKLEKLERIVSFYEGLPFLLLGDSSQEDAAHYLTLARRFPGRIHGVAIRMVRTRPERLQHLNALEAAFAEIDIPFHRFDESHPVAERLLASVRGF